MFCLLPHFNCHPDTFTTGTPPPPPPIIHTHRHHLILRSSAASAAKTRHFRPLCILSPSTPLLIFYNNNNNNNKFDAWPCVAAQATSCGESILKSEEEEEEEVEDARSGRQTERKGRRVRAAGKAATNVRSTRLLTPSEGIQEVLADHPEPETSDEQLIKLLMKIDLEKVLDSLNPREKQVIRLRFGMDDGRMRTLQQIADMLGTTFNIVKRIEGHAFRKLKGEMRVEHLQQHNMWLLNLAVKLKTLQDLIKLKKPQEDELDDPQPETADKQVIKPLTKMDLEKLLDSLDPREKQVIRWRFGMDGRMKIRPEIAKRMGVSTSRIQDLEDRALMKLKREMRVEHLHLPLQHRMLLHNLAVKSLVKSLERLEVLADPETDDELDDPQPETADEQVIKLLTKMDLEKLLDSLDPREKQVIRWRFGMDGRRKTQPEISKRMGVSASKIAQLEDCALMKLMREMRVKHLHLPLQHIMLLHYLAAKTLEPLEVLADPETDDELDDPQPETADEQVIKLLTKMDPEKVLDSLDPREKQVIRWRFGMDGRMKTLPEISKRMGVSKQRIAQLEDHALMKLKREMRVELLHLPLEHRMLLHNLAVKLRICLWHKEIFAGGFAASLL